MSIFNNSALTESAENELKLQIDSETSGLASAIAAEFSQIETLEKDVFQYSAPMIPIIQKPTSEGTKFIVELDMLQHLSEDTKVDIVKAFHSLCEANNIDDPNDLFVYIRGPLYKTLSNVNESNMKIARKALENLRSLKEADINLMKDIEDDPLEDDNEPQGVDMGDIPTDPNDDTINTIQDNENPKVVDDLEKTSRAISGQ